MSIQYSNYGRPRADLREALNEFNTGIKYIATDVLPILGVALKSAAVPVIRRENLKGAEVDHADGTAFPRVNLYTEDMNYACRSRGLEAPLTKAMRELYSRDFDAEVAITYNIENILKQRQEARAAALLFNPATWTGATLYTDYSSAPWDAVGTDIIAQVEDTLNKIRLNCGYQPDSILIGAVTMSNLLKNTGIKARFPGAEVITRQMILNNLSALFGIQNLFVGEAVYDSAIEGQNFVGADIWPDDYALIFKRNTGLPSTGGLGRTILWDAVTPDNVTVDQYIEAQTKADVFRVEHWVEEKVFDPYFAHLLKIDA